MLGDKDAVGWYSRIKTLETAKKFYEETLGLTQIDAEGQEVIVFRSGNSTIYVYKSQYARNQSSPQPWHGWSAKI